MGTSENKPSEGDKNINLNNPTADKKKEAGLESDEGQNKSGVPEAEVPVGAPAKGPRQD